MAEKSSSSKLWTPSNGITLLRICLVPVFVIALISPWPEWFGLSFINDATKSLIATGIFILISATDWVDGYLARKRHEVTTFGKFMDPLADKILVMAALLALIELGVLPAWPVLIILARDIIVSGVRMVAASQGKVIAASWYGKAKTVAQIIAIILFLIKDVFVEVSPTDPFSNPLYGLSWFVMLVALGLTIVSMADYLVKARTLIFGTEESMTAANNGLAQQVVDLAMNQSLTIGTAESLTGGMIASTLVNIAGSSAVVAGGLVTYQTREKSRLLSVAPEIINDEGVVSEACVRAMALGARKALDADVTVAVSGIAGPDGGDEHNPVGSVWIAWITPAKKGAKHFQFSGSRQEIREATVHEALTLLLSALESQK